MKFRLNLLNTVKFSNGARGSASEVKHVLRGGSKPLPTMATMVYEGGI